jgi:hypothetical protein
MTKSGHFRKLGRVRPKVKPACLAFGNYFKTFEGTTPPPAAVDYSAQAMPAIRQMYLNDQYGDCVIAGKMHALGVWSGNDTDHDPPGTVVAKDQEVLSQYHQICGPGDNGCVIADVLNWWKTKGLQAGGKTYKIDGFVSVNNRDPLEVKVALYLFGGLTIGVNLPNDWLNTDDGGIWDVTRSQIVGGHDVRCVGYNTTGVIISTWGGLRTITWAAFTSTAWVEECYVELAPLWTGNDKLAPCGVDASTLAADLAKLGGGVIPDVGPVDPPPEPPEPPTPPEPPVPPAPEPIPPPPWAVTGTVTIPSGILGRRPVTVPLENGLAAPGLSMLTVEPERCCSGAPKPPATCSEMTASLISRGLDADTASQISETVFQARDRGRPLIGFFQVFRHLEAAHRRGAVDPNNLAMILQFLLDILPLILPLFT